MQTNKDCTCLDETSRECPIHRSELNPVVSDTIKYQVILPLSDLEEGDGWILLFDTRLEAEECIISMCKDPNLGPCPKGLRLVTITKQVESINAPELFLL